MTKTSCKLSYHLAFWYTLELDCHTCYKLTVRLYVQSNCGRTVSGKQNGTWRKGYLEKKIPPKSKFAFWSYPDAAAVGAAAAAASAPASAAALVFTTALAVVATVAAAEAGAEAAAAAPAAAASG